VKARGEPKLSSEADNGDGVEKLPVPMLTITFDPRKYTVTVTGSVPNFEFAEYLLTTALRQTRKQIAARDRPRIAVPELAPGGGALVE